MHNSLVKEIYSKVAEDIWKTIFNVRLSIQIVIPQDDFSEIRRGRTFSLWQFNFYDLFMKQLFVP